MGGHEQFYPKVMTSAFPPTADFASGLAAFIPPSLHHNYPSTYLQHVSHRRTVHQAHPALLLWSMLPPDRVLRVRPVFLEVQVVARGEEAGRVRSALGRG